MLLEVSLKNIVGQGVLKEWLVALNFIKKVLSALERVTDPFISSEYL